MHGRSPGQSGRPWRRQRERPYGEACKADTPATISAARLPRGASERCVILGLAQPSCCLGGLVVVGDDLLSGRVVLVDLREQLLDELLGGDRPQRLTLGVDQAGVLGCGGSEVGVARLTDPVARGS